MASLQQSIEENETNPEILLVETVTESAESLNSSIEEVEIDFVAKIKKILFTLWRKIVVIRKHNDENVPQDRRGDQMKRVRLYHVWPGKNVFYLKGLLICGPDPRRLLLTIVCISLSSLVFSVYVAKYLSKNSNIINSFCVLLTLIVFANLIMVSVIDPEIIPRNDESPSPESTQNGRVRSKRVFVNGLELKLKYCRICNIYRPARSCHCIVCDNCVDKFDHHCPWIGQCIGLRNYRLYVLLLVIANVYFVYIFGFSCLKIQQKNGGNGNGLIGLVRDCPETLTLACFSFVAACFVGGLTCYHVYLIATNQTAYENFRQQYGSAKNPFNKGVVTNIKEALLSPWTPSRINFRSEI
ncbi:probable protein S-acyltransferase 6 [Solanum dulcamara]|uniref:probable protein S-acyltransferase 6 n=1 Tax=Solanum dulcamara TaxID=45834 RepID=UPI002485BED3|nr:probable protein S-acyltransferase 6 [Solanum dulcamara]